MPKVFDRRPNNHQSFNIIPKLNENDWTKLVNYTKIEHLKTFGIDYVSNGDYYWELYAVEIRSGNAEIRAYVVNEDYSPFGNKVLAFNYWPGASILPNEIQPKYFDRALASFTENKNGNNSVGWSYGGGSSLGSNGGPHTIWLSVDPDGTVNRVKGSDALGKTGWIDDHVTFNPIFRKVKKGSTNPEPTTQKNNVSLIVEIDGVVIAIFQSNSEEAPNALAKIKVLDPDGNILGIFTGSKV